MYKILIVCTGNICRSPMAEALMKNMLPQHMTGRVEISSAGTHAIDGNKAEPHAESAMEEIGIDLTYHHARLLNENCVGESNLILVMEPQQKDFILHSFDIDTDSILHLSDFNSERNLEEIHDPYGAPLKTYRQCARTIKACLENAISHIASLIPTS